MPSCMAQANRAPNFRLRSASLLAVASMAFFAEAGAHAELKRDGRWIFTERIEEGGSRKHMAATPAAEDGDVWLLVVCDAARVTASVMFSTPPAYVVRSPARLMLHSDNFPIVSVGAEIVQRTQVSLDPATTRHLMPLFSDSAAIVISIRDDGDAMHDYTFSLQPADRPIDKIQHLCSNQND